MLVLLTIGYHRLVLPNEKGLATILKAMSEARMVEDDERYKHGRITLKQEDFEVKVEILPGYKFAPRKSTAIDPDEVLPPSRSFPALPARSIRQLPTGQLRLAAPSHLLEAES